MELHQSSSEPRPRATMFAAWGIALAVVVLCGIGIVWHFHRNLAPIRMALGPSLKAPVSQTIDLSISAATRGTPAGVPFASIPRRTVNLTLILPALSQTGPYAVSIRKTRSGLQVLTKASGIAVEQGRQTRLSVTLEMATVQPGVYYLSTTDRKNGVAYYYPLRVVPSS